MAKTKFRKTVIKTTTLLIEHGYELDEESKSQHVVFQKRMDSLVQCRVEFQLFQHFIAPIREFDVLLFRVQMNTINAGETRFKPLAMSLTSLLRGFYKQEIFPPGQFHWEFTDDLTLTNMILEAQSLLLKQGLKWLEDPISNMEWIKSET